MTLNNAVDIILGDMAIHVKTKVLKWDPKEVIKMNMEAKGIYDGTGP